MIIRSPLWLTIKNIIICKSNIDMNSFHIANLQIVCFYFDLLIYTTIILKLNKLINGIFIIKVICTSVKIYIYFVKDQITTETSKKQKVSNLFKQGDGQKQAGKEV